MRLKLRLLFSSIFGEIGNGVSLHHLEKVAQCFAQIPYENLTKIIQADRIKDVSFRLRMPVLVLNDFKILKTGGTCFSLTWCMKEILESYGYQCAIHMADLGGGTNNHCAMMITLADQQYLIDPGYLITKPLPLPESGQVVHPTQLYPVRLERSQAGNRLTLSTLEPSGEKHRYELEAMPCSHAQFMQYWEDSYSWTMMNSILVVKAIPCGRLYLHDRYIRKFSKDSKQGGNIKAEYDLNVAEITGIEKSIVQTAREILSRHKMKLRER